MENEHTLSALIRKRAEISAHIEDLQGQLKQAVVDLDHVEATLVIFKPDIHLEPLGNAPIPQQHRAFRGEVTRIVLNLLRDAANPLTTPEIAEAVMRERGLNPDDKRFRKVMLGRVGACLKRWEHLQTLQSEWVLGEKCKRWRMAENRHPQQTS